MSENKILDRVAALLAKAESTPFGPERDAFHAKAEELMLKHAIDRAELAAREGRSLKAEVVKKEVRLGPEGHWMTKFMQDMLYALVRHNRCKAVIFPGSKTFDLDQRMAVVGLKDDVEFVEMLFASLRLTMAADLEPKPEAHLSFDENLARLKEAGCNWEEAHRLMHRAGLEPREWKRSVGVSYTKRYTDFCAETGRERRNVNPITIRREFARGFVAEVQLRLAREARARQERETASGSTTALVPVKSAVDEVYKEMFPKLRKGRASVVKGTPDAQSYARGRASGQRADLGGPRISPRKAIER